MNFEWEIRDLKAEIDRIDTELEEVGLLLNSRGELSKVLGSLIELNTEFKNLNKNLEVQMKKPKSPKFSFKGWNLWEFVRGRKKTIVTVLGSIMGYFALGQDLQGLLAGPIFEAVWATLEYFYKEYK